MRSISACLLVVLLFFLIPLKTFALTDYNFHTSSEGQINDALTRIVPTRFLISSPMYYLISFKENVRRFFQPSSVKKAEFDMVLSGKKIKEVYLLLQNEDMKNSSRTLQLYSDRIKKMSDELEKARSQNQDVTKLVDVVAENLRLHETLFYAIDKKRGGMKDSFAFDENFAHAVSAYKQAVLVIDNVKPGVKDRFGVTKNEATQEAAPSPTPTDEPLIQGSSSAKPRKIIY